MCVLHWLAMAAEVCAEVCAKPVVLSNGLNGRPQSAYLSSTLHIGDR